MSGILVGRYAVQTLTGARATERAMYELNAPAVLHLATHGFFLQDLDTEEASADPFEALGRSGLALASANQGAKATAGAGDGILTALEATTLNLAGTRLVVLSACDTGVGQIEIGDGIYGLARAFGEAGAEAVLATLWPVDDEATQEFMLGFYRRFIGGAAAPAALRATQLEFLAHPRWSDPRYWAPFVLMGG